MRIINAGYEILTPISEGGIEELKRIEQAARTCYRSEDKITEDGESAKKLIKMLINKGHCLDVETEILTSTGWKKYNELKDNDLYATLNNNGFVEYVPKTNYIIKEYQGTMYNIYGQMIDLLVTDQHKLYVCKTSTKEGRKKNNYELIEAKDLENQSHCYLKNSNGYIPHEINNYSNNYLKLLGMIIGDGNIIQQNIKFHLKKQRKIQYIENILYAENIKYNKKYNEKDQTYSIAFSMKNIPLKYCYNQIYDENKEKQIPTELMMKLNYEQSRALLDGLINSDGCISRTNYNKYSTIYYSTTSKKLAGQFQQLCLHCGFSSNMSKDIDLSCTGFGSQKTANKLSVIKRYNKPEISKGKNTKLTFDKIENWKGTVWCIDLPPYHLIYVRRNGKPCWIGNCAMLEHSSITIKFICSRAISHELVRHRLSSWAEMSQRYVNFSKEKFGEEITVVKPLTFREYSPVYVEWLQSCRAAEEAYFNILKLDEGYTPQEAREVLPNSTATEIIMTCNYRELRHFLKLRTDIAAHPYMREITRPLLDELKSRIPIIFDDIEYAQG